MIPTIIMENWLIGIIQTTQQLSFTAEKALKKQCYTLRKNWEGEIFCYISHTTSSVTAGLSFLNRGHNKMKN